MKNIDFLMKTIQNLLIWMLQVNRFGRVQDFLDHTEISVLPSKRNGFQRNRGESVQKRVSNETHRFSNEHHIEFVDFDDPNQ